MTEKKWFAETNGEVLADHWGDRFTERKAHLLMLAACRRHPQYVSQAALAAALDAVAAHFANPDLPDAPFNTDELRALYPRVNAVARRRVREPGRGISFGVLAAVEPRSIGEDLEESLNYLVYSCLHDVAAGLDDTAAEHTAQADLVREVLGNPFNKKLKIKPAWRTDTVLALARQMFIDDEFGAMPILADALQDAGCDSDPILNHCRDTAQVHVRGCWVLDMLFGKR